MTPRDDEASVAALRRLRVHPDALIRNLAITAERVAGTSRGVHHVSPAELTDAERTVLPLIATAREEDIGSIARSIELTPARVTVLVREAAKNDAEHYWDFAGVFEIATRIAYDVGESSFQPDIAGLYHIYSRFLVTSDLHYLTMLVAESPRRDLDRPRVRMGEPEATLLRETVAWLVSRAGLAPLLVEVDRLYRMFEAIDRYAIMRLLEDAAQRVNDPDPPGSGSARPPRFVAETHPPAPRVVDEDVQFTVYRPRTVRPARWHTLLAYVHRSTPFIDEDGEEVDPVSETQRRAEQALGPRASFYGPVNTDIAASLPRGNELVLEPWIVKGEFNPARSAIRWEEPIHEVPFRLRVPAHADGQRLDAGMRVYLGVLLIAELRFSVRVDSAAAQVAESNDPVRVAPYRRIFASYSHRDTEVVARLRAAAAALGDSYLIDLDDLRAGEAWEPRLADLITEADVFQLFWSRNSMRSPFVRQEWEHALSLNRAHFVRPVYWEDPRPEDPVEGLPPSALDRLQFCWLQPIAIGSSTPPPSVSGGFKPLPGSLRGFPQVRFPQGPPTEAVGRGSGRPAGRTWGTTSRRSSRQVVVLVLVVALLIGLVVVIAVLH